MAFRQVVSRSMQYRLLSNMQQARNYADMSFTFASPVQVSFEMTLNYGLKRTNL